MTSEVHELRCEKVEVIKKKIFEHEFSAQNNVHKGVTK